MGERGDKKIALDANIFVFTGGILDQVRELLSCWWAAIDEFM